MPGNPPTAKNVTVRYGQLQSLGSGGLTTQGAPALNTIQYKAKLPSSTQWSAGMQMAIPWATTIDVEWVGQHSFNSVRTVNINAVDFGSAYLPQNQNPNLVSATPGGAAVSTDLMRTFQGYAAINQRTFDGWRTFHSLQLSLNRRFRNGVSFGMNDTWVLYDHAIGAPRLQHNADGTFSFRDDQQQADDLLNTFILNRHVMKGNFVWDMPDLHADGTALKVTGWIVNDWQLSGVWTGSTDGTTPTTTGAGAYSIGYTYTSRWRQREHHRLARLRRPRPHRRRPGQRLQRQSLQAVQHGGVPGTADQQQRARVRGGLHEAAASRACWTWPSPATSTSAAAATCSSGWRCSTPRTARSSSTATPP